MQSISVVSSKHRIVIAWNKSTTQHPVASCVGDGVGDGVVVVAAVVVVDVVDRLDVDRLVLVVAAVVEVGTELVVAALDVDALVVVAAGVGAPVGAAHNTSIALPLGGVLQ